jgi:hypothetical protein
MFGETDFAELQQCLVDLLGKLVPNLLMILFMLQSAEPDMPIVAMDSYYQLFVAPWLNGPAGRAMVE